MKHWRAALIVAAGLIAYSNSLSAPFIVDDEPAIVQNTHIRSLDPGEALFPVREVPTAGRPLVNLSLAINYALGGLAVEGYHAWNIALHLLCALLVFGLARRTLETPRLSNLFRGQATDVAFAIALIWVVHPLNTEVVDYTTQRTESTMALFYLLTVYASVRAFGSRRSAAWAICAAIACALGMMSKESMVTAPLVVLLFDRVFLYSSFGAAMRARWKLYAGLAATWLILVAVLSSGPRIYTVGFSLGVSAWTYLLNQTVMIARYLELAFWPRSLVVAYGPPPPATLSAVWPFAIFVAALLAATVTALARWPAWGFLGAWFFITLAPTSSVLPIATEVGAERRMYLPLVAVVAAVVVATAIAWQRFAPRRTAWQRGIALAMLAGLLVIGTRARNREYESPLTIAQTALDRWPSGFAHWMVGTSLGTTGRHDEAIAHLREASRSVPTARYSLGVELFTAGSSGDAIDELQAFLRDQSYRLEAIHARTVLGRAFVKERRWPEATAQFEAVLAVTPVNDEDHIVAVGSLGDVLFAQRRFEEARVRYVEYLSWRRSDESALTNLGIALAATGRTDQAILAFRRVVELMPNDENARRNLARALATAGRAPEGDQRR